MSPKELAERYISLIIQGEVLPVDDVDFEYGSVTDYMKAVERKRRSPGCKEYLLTLAELFAHTDISTFFGIQLLNEAYLGYGAKFNSPEPLLHGAKRFLCIDFSKEEYGIFDREKALRIEDTYFQELLPYLSYKESQNQLLVSLDRWMMDLWRRKLETGP